MIYDRHNKNIYKKIFFLRKTFRILVLFFLNTLRVILIRKGVADAGCIMVEDLVWLLITEVGKKEEPVRYINDINFFTSSPQTKFNGI